MTELDLYKFIHHNKLEWHTYNGDIFLIIPIYQLTEFTELIKDSGLIDEEGLDIILKNGYVVIPDMEMICGYYGIETENIFNPEDEY